jgi:hypothetical protein
MASAVFLSIASLSTDITTYNYRHEYNSIYIQNDYSHALTDYFMLARMRWKCVL